MQNIERIVKQYNETLKTIARALAGKGIEDVNPVQALLLASVSVARKTQIKALTSSPIFFSQNVSYNVHELTKKGYLVYEKHPTDKRSTVVSLTATGETVLGVVVQVDKMLSVRP